MWFTYIKYYSLYYYLLFTHTHIYLHKVRKNSVPDFEHRLMRHPPGEGLRRQGGKPPGVGRGRDGPLEKVQPPRGHVRQLFLWVLLLLVVLVLLVWGVQYVNLYMHRHIYTYI